MAHSSVSSWQPSRLLVFVAAVAEVQQEQGAAGGEPCDVDVDDAAAVEGGEAGAEEGPAGGQEEQQEQENMDQGVSTELWGARCWLMRGG